MLAGDVSTRDAHARAGSRRGIRSGRLPGRLADGSLTQSAPWLPDMEPVPGVVAGLFLPCRRARLTDSSRRSLEILGPGPRLAALPAECTLYFHRPHSSRAPHSWAFLGGPRAYRLVRMDRIAPRLP